jgi:hypothetical protein
MKPTATLDRLRPEIGQTWIIAVFGACYVVSQATMFVILRPLGASFLWLQCLGFSARQYLAVFRQWEAEGVMAAYRSHFLLDDVHWLWYAGLFTAALCRLFEHLRVPSRFNWLLLLPLASGLFDWYENRLQHVFLSSRNFATVVDPLPLLSTLASDAKWLLACTYVSLTAVLLCRAIFGRQAAV